MSDDCSRLWYFTDVQLLAHFNSSFPQNQPWRLCPLREQMCCSLISALLLTKSAPASLLNVPRQWKTIGTDGMGSDWSSASTATCGARKSMSLSSKYLAIEIAMADLRPVTTPSEFTRWRCSRADVHQIGVPWHSETRLWRHRLPRWSSNTSPQEVGFAPKTCKTDPYHYHHFHVDTSLRPATRRIRLDEYWMYALFTFLILVLFEWT
jgi:hypothetical protein